MLTYTKFHDKQNTDGNMYQLSNEMSDPGHWQKTLARSFLKHRR